MNPADNSLTIATAPTITPEILRDHGITSAEYDKLVKSLGEPRRRQYVMKGINYVLNDKGRAIAVQIDLKRHGAAWEEFCDGVVSELRRAEKSIPYAQYRAKRATRK